MATFTDPLVDPQFDNATHARLIQAARATDSNEQAWLYLEAAHAATAILCRSGG